ncbi:MAG: hypothetical protein V2I63_02015 [Pseudomonadales bacterium]|nr:hypothetical protein [Pseudomonadales bacterium]
MSAAAADRWHPLFTAAQTHQARGELGEALAAYDRAVAAVDREFHEAEVAASSAMPLLLAKLVSHENRAAVLEQLGRVEQARAELRLAAAFAGAIQDEPRMPDALRRAARAHLRALDALRSNARSLQPHGTGDSARHDRIHDQTPAGHRSAAPTLH